MDLKRPTQTELDQMSHAENDALILKLFDRLEAFEQRLKELEAKVEKNSRNSSKPPSSDGLKKGAAEPRQRGEKPTGGQAGHQGVIRRMVDNPDEIREFRPAGLCACGASLDAQAALSGERRQQFEIPEPKYVVTEYRQMRVVRHCGREHRGEFPAGITPHASFGPRLKAYAVGLVQGRFVPLERASAIIGDPYGIQPSGGTVQKWVTRVADRLAPAHEANRRTILLSEAVHFDESGMRINGKLHWQHAATSSAAVYYSVHEKRGREAMEAAGILPHFKGNAAHDHWKPCQPYSDCTHWLCNAHHLRKLRYCEELTGRFWPIELRRILVEGKNAVDSARAEGKTALEPAQVEPLLARYDSQVANGLAAAWPVRPPEPGHKGRPKQHDATNLLLRLRDFKTQVLGFLTDWQIPFDNNLAERMVRPVKVKLKVTGGFRAIGGSEAFCILRSIRETDKLIGKNPFDTLRLAFEGE